jgi:uncharacterized protein (DUF58 family)
VPLPTPRTALLLALGSLVALAAIARPSLLFALLALDALVLAAALLDFLRAPRSRSLRARRSLREPLSAFAENPVSVELTATGSRRLRLQVADAPPASFRSRGHRARLDVPAPGTASLGYVVVPRERGLHHFGDLHVRAFGPWGLAARQWRLPLQAEVKVYPDLRALGRLPAPGSPEPGLARARGHWEGREFASLRPYAVGDDFRSVDWKATARRGAPIVRETEPERNQTLWLLLDCGRHLSARLSGGRTKLDHAIDASLALARAAARRGDQVAALLFGAEVRRVVPPGRGAAQLGPLAKALFAAEARVEESDYAAAFDALAERQRRRAMVVVFTDLADPDTSALLLARAALLCRRHLALVAAVADSAVADAARASPRTEAEAYARLAAERILGERELAERRLRAAGVRVESVSASDLTAAVVGSYLAVKASGRL